mmetsp:Transcript_85952/g.174416  ORF Transcript_85952/g.174416 Transcript_85952/m.174416 type:complete len:96 (-) Transcript_85952:405-692(-)
MTPLVLEAAAAAALALADEDTEEDATAPPDEGGVCFLLVPGSGTGEIRPPIRCLLPDGMGEDDRFGEIDRLVGGMIVVLYLFLYFWLLCCVVLFL